MQHYRINKDFLKIPKIAQNKAKRNRNKRSNQIKSRDHSPGKGTTADRINQRGKMSCNPLERVEKNESFPTCRANRFMIGHFNQSLKDLRSEMKMINVYKQREINNQRAEIKDLKDKCKHLEEVMAYIKTLNQIQQGETSSRYSKKR